MSNILIVDDETENRESLKRALGDDNPSWNIYLADGYFAGKSLIEEQFAKGDPIDVLLTDLVMETEQDGMNLVSEATRIDPFIMAILFTAKEKSLNRYEAFDLGAFDVVEKNMRGKSAVQEIIVKTRAALRYREWSQRINSLSRFFDPGVFKQIEQDPAILELREREVTICFWDIRGFSKLCETIKAHPDLIAGFLKEYSEVAATTILDHGGILDKFIGDGVMALFGALTESEDEGREDAFKSVQAAFAFRTRFDEIYDRWKQKWELYTPEKIEIGLGCGIHSGRTLVGNVGSKFRDQFTALGPSVNFASRIEGRSESGQIILSQSTKQRVDKRVRVVDSGVIKDIKNIDGTYPLYRAEQ